MKSIATPARLLLTIFTLTTLLFWGCEYTSDKEHFVELDPPPDHVQIDIQLMEPGDTLKLFTPIQLNYNFGIGQRRFVQGSISLGPKTFPMQNAKGFLMLNPEDFEPGYHTLLVEFYFTTGSGSMADQAQAELYKAEMEWVTVADNRPPQPVPLSHHISEDGLLTLTWTPSEQYNFEAYQIIRSQAGSSLPWASHIITQRNITSFTDSCYIGQGATYTLSTLSYGQSSSNSGSNQSRVILQRNEPVLQFEKQCPDSVKIWWSSRGFNELYTLLRTSPHPSTTLLSNATDTSFVFQTPPFGKHTGFSLSVVPSTSMYCGPYNAFRIIDNYYLGKNLGTSILFNSDYNSLEKTYYSKSSDNMLAIDIETLEIINSVNIPQLQHGRTIACQPGSSRVATKTRQNIHVFENNQFTDEVLIGLDGSNCLGYLFFSQNGYLATIQTGNQFQLFSLSSQEPVASFVIPEMPHYSSWAGIDMAVDASFAGISTHNGIWLYQNHDMTFEEIFQDQRNYTSILFHPTEPNLVYVGNRDEGIVELRSLPDFTLQQSWQLPAAGVICNIDPHTGFMLVICHPIDRLIVLDLTSEETVFSIKSSDYRPRLFHNTLFSNTGYAWDISQYIAESQTRKTLQP